MNTVGSCFLLVFNTQVLFLSILQPFSIHCQTHFINFQSPLPKNPDDVYGIEELTIYKGTHSEKVYACAGDMLDGYFYDLLMNLLSEKGITDEFVSKVSELATQYEQSLFVNLLQETKKFFESK